MLGLRGIISSGQDTSGGVPILLTQGAHPAHASLGSIAVDDVALIQEHEADSLHLSPSPVQHQHDFGSLTQSDNAPGYARWNETTGHPSLPGAQSPVLYPTDESNAVTPRYSATSPSGSRSLTPSHAPFPHARVRPGAANTILNESRAHAVSTLMVHAPASSNGQGRQGAEEAVVSGHEDAEAASPARSECLVVKTQPGDENDASWMPVRGSQQELSDEELIAMLADCATKPTICSHDNFAQVLSERMIAMADELHEMQHSDSDAPSHDEGSGLEPGDHALMAALASCCGGQSPFEAACGDADTSASDRSHVFKSADSAPATQREQPLSLAHDAGQGNSSYHWLDDDAPENLLWQH